MFLTLNEASFGPDRMLGSEAGDPLREKGSDTYVEHRLYSTAMAGDLVVCVGKKPEVL